jgi:predicted molibdopterin-dependent oxidoreductase YjgC
VRDDRIVQVKARLNPAVNKEWLCDEGRYGFERFQPPIRATEPMLRSGDGFQPATWEQAGEKAKLLKGNAGSTDAAVFLSPFLTMEEMWLALQFAEQVMGVTPAQGRVAVQLRQRSLTEVEAILISPDYAPNARAMTALGVVPDSADWRNDFQQRYQALLEAVRKGEIQRILLVGDGAIHGVDNDAALQTALGNSALSLAISSRGIGGVSGQAVGGVHEFCHLVFPGRTVNEKSGVFVNKDLRLQRLRALLTAPVGSQSDWMILSRIGATCGKQLLPAGVIDDRALFREMVKRVKQLNGLTLARLGAGGLALSEISSEAAPSSPAVGAAVA